MFKIYYSDRSVLISQMENNPNAPPGRIPMESDRSNLKHSGVIAIVQDDLDVGWTVITGYEYYYYKDNRWIGTDFWGVLDFLEEYGVITIDHRGAILNGRVQDMAQLRFLAKERDIISGQMVPKSLQEAIFAEIYSDPDLNRLGEWTYPERAITVRAPRGKPYASKKWEV